MFTGSYKHQLDAKNRIRIPAAYKNGMSGELIMCASANRCIGVYTKEGFEQVFSKYFTAGVFDAELQKRFTNSSAAFTPWRRIIRAEYFFLKSFAPMQG